MADGSLPLPHSWDTVIVDQHLPAASQNSAVEEVLDADVRRVELLKSISALETNLATCDVDVFSKLSDRMQQLQTQLDRWEVERVEVTKILVGLGFRHGAQAASGTPALDTPVCELSGGWQMKVQLAKALWLKPRLLLLDEPTNHLDFSALLWLENKLEEYPHTTVVVSHDVSFLHSACREILWINNKKVESMPRDMVSQEDLARMQR